MYPVNRSQFHVYKWLLSTSDSVSRETVSTHDSMTYVHHAMSFVTQYVYRYSLSKGEGGRKGDTGGRRTDKCSESDRVRQKGEKDTQIQETGIRDQD
jgi:hypothetical protein